MFLVIVFMGMANPDMARPQSCERLSSSEAGAFQQVRL